MNRSILLTLTALLLFVGIFLFIIHENSQLPPAMDYIHFNRADPIHAQTIMDTWRHERIQKEAVKMIVLLDYALIIVYTSYLCWALVRRKKRVRQLPGRHWQVGWLTAAIVFIAVGALLDVIQDSIIYGYVSAPEGHVQSLQILTWLKFRTLGVGLLILIGSWVPPSWVRNIPVRTILDYFRQILKSIWLFFPSLLFLLLTIVAFWIQGQGQDILVAFTEADRSGFRLFFFLVVAFWVYVSWYSSRVISDIKQGDDRIKERFLYNYPRLAGNACLLVVELALLQAPIRKYPLSLGWATAILAIALIALYFADKWIGRQMGHLARLIGKGAGWLFVAFVVIAIVTSLIHFSPVGYIYGLLSLVILLHFLYLFYINLRRARLTEEKKQIAMAEASGFSQTILAFFCIPLREISYVQWLIGVSLLAIGLDVTAILNLDIARKIGPFSLVLLGFAVLLAFGSLITALSVRLRVNIHFLLFLMALLFGLKETHDVKQIRLEHTKNAYDQRPSLRQYLQTWLQRLPNDSSAYDMYLVLANGGASRSGYWTAAVLGRLEDSSRHLCPQDTFSRHLFCLSGTSGGGVGVAAFFALLNDHQPRDSANYQHSGANFLQKDYFSYTLARMLGPDFFNYIFHVTQTKDRGRALEEAFEGYADTVNNYHPRFDRPISEFPAMNGDKSQVLLPILFVNTTQMQNGTPGVVTNLRLDTMYFNQRIDVLGLLAADSDISMASGAILGARFPYLSPAGRIGNHYFVDGGYFDNSGAGVVQELLRGIMTIAREDSMYHDRWLYHRVKRLHIKVLHIVNSPVNGTDTLESVAPIKNDLLSPVLTIVGAYGMQTTVNDARLYHYLDDIDSNLHIAAEHRLISLYKDTSESKIKEAPYSMNWFISDTTRHRIDLRLDNQPQLNSTLQQLSSSPCKK